MFRMAPRGMTPSLVEKIRIETMKEKPCCQEYEKFKTEAIEKGIVWEAHSPLGPLGCVSTVKPGVVARVFWSNYEMMEAYVSEVGDDYEEYEFKSISIQDFINNSLPNLGLTNRVYLNRSLSEHSIELDAGQLLADLIGGNIHELSQIEPLAFGSYHDFFKDVRKHKMIWLIGSIEQPLTVVPHATQRHTVLIWGAKKNALEFAPDIKHEDIFFLRSEISLIY